MNLPLAPARNPVVDPAWPTNPTINLIFTAGSGLAVLAGLALAVRYYRQEGTVAGFTCLVGGAVASLFEPLTAANGFVYYPRQEQITLFAAYDVKIPLFLTLSYTAEIGLGALAVWRLLRAGGGPQAIVKVWLVVALGDVVLETPALWLHVFYYYGPQPLDLWGMPMYWAVLDGALGILPGVVEYLTQPWARKPWHQLVIVALFPSSVAFFYVGAGWPIWTLMHTDLPEPWIWAGSLVTVALTYLFVRVLAAASTLSPEVVAGLRAVGWAPRARRASAKQGADA